MGKIFVQERDLPLRAALCRLLEDRGEEVIEEIAPCEAAAFFPRLGQSGVEEFIREAEKIAAISENAAVLAIIPYFVWAGEEGDPLQCAAAGGICAAVRKLAGTYARKNIRFNCLRFGYLDGAEDKIAEKIALGRVARPEEIARTAAFFLKEGSLFMTGQNIDANGGRIY